MSGYSDTVRNHPVTVTVIVRSQGCHCKRVPLYDAITGTLGYRNLLGFKSVNVTSRACSLIYLTYLAKKTSGIQWDLWLMMATAWRGTRNFSWFDDWREFTGFFALTHPNLNILLLHCSAHRLTCTLLHCISWPLDKHINALTLVAAFPSADEESCFVR